MKKTIMSIIVGSSLMVFGTYSFASENANSPSIEHPMEHRDFKKFDEFSFGPFSGLKLTQEQKDKISAIDKERREDKVHSLSPRDSMKELVAMNKEIKSLSNSSEYSSEKVKAIFEKYAKDFESKVSYQSEKDHQIFEILDKEQKDIYLENQAKFDKRVDKFIQGQGGGFRHMGPPPHPHDGDRPFPPRDGQPPHNDQEVHDGNGQIDENAPPPKL